jgi:putative PIN family toxin of toxin-antitoxin system
MERVILDTNILVSGLKSKNGISYRILKMLPQKRFILCLSVPLFLEYESVIKSQIPYLSKDEINNFLDYICLISKHIKINYLWRPILKDHHDDHILEVAVASNSKYIVTYNIKDFIPCNKFGIDVVTPREFLEKIGELK